MIYFNVPRDIQITDIDTVELFIISKDERVRHTAITEYMVINQDVPRDGNRITRFLPGRPCIIEDIWLEDDYVGFKRNFNNRLCWNYLVGE